MSQTRILIAGSSPELRDDLLGQLGKKNFQTRFHPNIDETLLDFIEKDEIDLLLVDINAKTEKTVIKTIEKIKLKKQIPFICIIEELNDILYENLMDMNPSGIVSKPVYPRNLLATIKIALQHFPILKETELEKALNRLKNKEASLQFSEDRFRGAFESAAHGMAMSSTDGVFLNVNQAFCDIVGYNEEELLSMEFKDITHPDDFADDLGNVKKIIDGEIESFQLEKRFISKSGYIVWVLLSVSVVRDTIGSPLQFVGHTIDITERKLAEETFKTALSFNQEPHTTSTDELINKSLEEGVRLTESEIGFFHLVEDDQKIISLQTWTQNTLNYCTAVDKGTHYPVDQAGVWGDCIREKRPVIHNDYPNLPHRKGLPEGHVPISRELTVPVFQDDKIVAVIGVGNKRRDYTLMDQKKLSLIAETVWGVVQRRKAETALRESNERYRSMFNNTHAVMLIINPEDGAIIDANPAACEYYRYRRKELLDKKISDINTLSPEEIKIEMENAKQERRKQFIFKHRLNNGEIRDVEVYSGPLFVMGKPYLYSIIHDITDRKKMEKSLRLSEEQHRTLFETMTQGAIYFDARGRILSANPAAARILSLKLENMIGKIPSDYPYRVITEDGHELSKEDLPITSVLKTGKALRDFIIGYHLKEEDRHQWIVVNAIPQYRPGEDRPYQIYATYTDITELRQAQEEINLFFNVTLDMLCIVNFQGYFTKLSPSWSKNLGWSDEELMSRPFLDLVHEEDRDRTLTEEKSLQTGGDVVNFENRYRCKDGSYKWLSWNSFAIPERNILIAAAHDITQLKLDEKELKKSERRLMEAQRVAHLGHWELDYSDNTLYWSEELYRIFGLDSQNFPATYEAFIEAIHPDDREYVDQRYRESVALKADYEVTHRIIRPDGEIRHVFEKCENFFHEDGHITRSLGTVWDITERVETEEKLLISMQEADIAREQAENANRAKSEFLANMSHEIRTPLNAVTGFSELLSSLVSDEQQKSYLESIKTAGKSLLTLINDILDLSKIEAGMMEIQYEAVNPFSLFKEIEQIFSPKIAEKGLQFLIEIDPELPVSLILDEARLRQVLLNIVGNAVKFTDKGHIRLIAQKKYNQKINNQLNLIITIEDTGIGMPEADFDIIFESFRQRAGQSSRKYGGTGLGLSISKRLVEIMNGEIVFSSRENTGTTFIINLHEVKVADPHKKSERRRGIDTDRIRFRGNRILVVDDVESNRNFLIELLTEKNLKPDEAKNGQEALELIRNNTYDVVLMDIRMPVMDGLEALKEIRGDKTIKDTIIVALTASVQKDERNRVLEAGFNGFIPKPINITELYREISRYIDAEPANNDEFFEADIPLQIPQLPQITDPELITILKGEIIPVMKELTGAVKPQLVFNLTKKLYELSETYNIKSFSDYCQLLNRNIENYDISGLQSAMKKIINVIRKAIEN